MKIIKSTQTITRFAAILLASLTLMACGSSDDDDSRNATLQVIHASADAPPVNIIADGNPILQNFDFGNTSGQLIANAGIVNVDVQALLADNTSPSVIGPVDIDLAENTDTLVIAINSVSMIEPLVITREAVEIPEGQTRVRIGHLAPQAPQVDIYVTAPDADLTSATPVATASFKDVTDEIQVDSGDYQVRITPAGSQTVVFDSGTIALPSAGDLAIFAIENTLTGASPVQLLVASEAQGGSIILDTNLPADLRVIHASPDAPAVDIVVNDGFAAPLVPNLAFGSVAGFVQVAPDTYNVKVVPTGTTMPVVIDADLPVNAGLNYSVFAVGTLENIEPLVVTRDRRRVGTEAKVDIIHASPAAGNVDIYVTAPGTDIATVDANFSGVPFRASTSFVSLPAGSYDVTVTAEGTKTAAIGPATITVEAGGLYTAVAVDEVRTDADPDGLRY